ncbi:Stage 0 sporulation protein H [uncultured Roseburia sp.]|uniref:RNA polymerase sigma factor SigS n=1 Tax=Brotonthovivens ammoniilytica TaxID=2981725 RepID=A0ABT2TMW0_9FIRM|nr:RNA polymerase sporulation sigma factor SigH [Brotonthovivens ammoniilytica]MCU6763568.1 RNA polymerase sporulation sigma factor SigH [Brotonthovivens ammoniilytica]SCJ25308.1 Stage 0 sporulation protein H [uncultured Roseburia sp.]
MDKDKYQDQADEQLLIRLKAGESDVMDYLLEKYKNLVRKKANAMFLLGGDTDDLIQEGMIGLFKAIRDYDEEKGGNFFGFAELCITRQIYSAVETAARKKHGPLNSYISLFPAEAEEREVQLWNVELEDQDENPENMLIHQENLDMLLQKISECLSTLEREVLEEYLKGMNYRQIAHKFGKPEKSIDNAMQRIKNKIAGF